MMAFASARAKKRRAASAGQQRADINQRQVSRISNTQRTNNKQRETAHQHNFLSQLIDQNAAGDLHSAIGQKIEAGNRADFSITDVT